MNFEIENSFKDNEAWYISVVGKIGGMDFSMCNVYYPPDPQLMLTMIDLVVTKSKGVLIMVLIMTLTW